MELTNQSCGSCSSVCLQRAGRAWASKLKVTQKSHDPCMMATQKRGKGGKVLTYCHWELGSEQILVPLSVLCAGVGGDGGLA